MANQSTAFGQAPTPPGGILPSFQAQPSPRCWHTGGNPASAAADFNDSTPNITEEYLCEVYVPAPTTLTGISVFNGSDVTGNKTLNLRNAQGVVVANSASVAGSGTDAYQKYPFTAPYRITPGTYYVGCQFSSATARYNTHVLGTFGAGKLTSQTYGTLVTAVMPVTFTTALGPVATLY